MDIEMALGENISFRLICRPFLNYKLDYKYYTEASYCVWIKLLLFQTEFSKECDLELPPSTCSIIIIITIIIILMVIII
jgi:hypothetical protein